MSEIEAALDRATQAVKDAANAQEANAEVVKILTECSVKLETRIATAIAILQGSNDAL